MRNKFDSIEAIFAKLAGCNGAITSVIIAAITDIIVGVMAKFKLTVCILYYQQ